MQIESLQLRHFRNIHEMDLNFSPRLNLIHGRNAQGKTNLLEAIYMLVTGRSFRTSHESELIPWNDPAYENTIIRATIRKSNGADQLTYCFNSRSKRIQINGKPIDRMMQLIGRLNAVLFTPADLLLVRGAPTLRRRFLDIAISQVNPRYLIALQSYQHALKNRNVLLKQGNRIDEAQLSAYDQILSESGAVIILHRSLALEQVALYANQAYRNISSESSGLSLAYEPDIPAAPDQAAIQQSIIDVLLHYRSEDLRRMTTHRGPHRDDFDLLIQGHSARNFASQGQQRSAVLALKVAEVAYLQSHTGEWPILMLDDLMSELDEMRRESLLTSLNPEIQTFITTTEARTVTAHVNAEAIFRISAGSLTLNPT